jgi:hypothetical protein
LNSNNAWQPFLLLLKQSFVVGILGALLCSCSALASNVPASPTTQIISSLQEAKSSGCTIFKLFLTDANQPHLLEGPAEGPLDLKSKHDRRLVAFVSVPHAARLQVKYYFGSTIDALSMILNDIDMNRYEKQIRSKNSESNMTLSAVTQDQIEFDARVQKALGSVQEYIQYDYPVDKLKRATVGGWQAFFLDNNLLYPPHRSRFREGRVSKIEIRALDKLGNQLGQSCFAEIKWY